MITLDFCQYTSIILEDSGVDWRIVLRWIFKKLDVGASTGLNWLMTGTGGGHL